MSLTTLIQTKQSSSRTMVDEQRIDCQFVDHRTYLTEQEIADIEHETTILETREAAGIEALKIVQNNRGWISDESLYAISDLLQIPAATLEGVATFYNLIYRQKVGKHVIHVCDSISCYLTGYEDILDTLKATLNIEYGQTTDDGLFTLISNACLGGCDKAPTIMVSGVHYQQLTPTKVIDIIHSLKQGKQPEQESIAEQKTKGEQND